MRLLGVRRSAKWAGLALVAALGLTPGQAGAGERIIVGIQQNPNEPTQEKELGKETFKLWNRSAPGVDVSAPLMAPPSAPPIPKDKRSQQAEAERRWWMVLSPGELQNSDDESQGWLSPESLDKQLAPNKNSLSRPGDYTFYGTEKNQRGPNFKQTQASSAYEEEEDPARQSNTDAWRSLFGDAGGSAGKKTEDKSRYGSTRLNTDSESMLHDFLKEMSVQSFAPQIRPWEKENTRPNQIAELNPRSWNDPGNKLPGLGSPMQTPGGDPMPRATPVMPSTLPETSSARSPGYSSPLAGSQVGLPRSFSSELPSANSPRSVFSGFGGSAVQQPLGDTRNSMPTVMGPMFNREIKQRNGL